MPSIESIRHRVWDTPVRRFITISMTVFVALLVCRASVLDNPLYWDAIQGPFVEAIWLKNNGFNYWELLTKQEGGTYGGAALYIWSVLPTLYGLLYKVLSTPSSVFLVLHLVAFALTGVVLATVDLVLRRRLEASSLTALLGMLVILSHPTFGAQVDAVSMALPVACAVIVVGAVALHERWMLLGGLTCLSLFVKDSLTIVALANVVFLGFCIVAGKLERKQLAWAIPVNLLPVIIRFTITSTIAHIRISRELESFDRSHVNLSVGTKQLWDIATRAYPETYLMLAVAFVFFLFFSIRKLKAIGLLEGIKELGRDKVWLCTFYAMTVSMGYVMFQVMSFTIVRYITWFLAFFVIAFIGSLYLIGLKGRAVVIILLCLSAFHFINTYGALRPGFPPEGTFPLAGDWLERSREYLGDLESEREVARFLEENAGDRIIICQRMFDFQLALPEMGFVKRPLKVATGRYIDHPNILFYKDLNQKQVLNAWFIHKYNGCYTIFRPEALPPFMKAKEVTSFEYRGYKTLIYGVEFVPPPEKPTAPAKPTSETLPSPVVD